MNNLRLIRTQRNITQEKLAELAETSQAQIAKLEKSARIKIDWALKLAPFLGVSALDLLDDPPQSERELVNKLDGRASANRHGAAGAQSMPSGMGVAPSSAAGISNKIPVMSAARGGIDQEMFLEDGPIDWVERPDYLKNARDPYAIWVVGESMMPRFRPAQILHVNPYKPPTPGAGVIVCKTNKAVLIKEWVGRSAEGVMLREYQPKDRTFTIPTKDVLNVHSVVGLQEP